MNKRKINLQQHQMKAAPRSYLVKTIIYVIILLVLGLLISRIVKSGDDVKVKEVTSIESVSLDLNDTIN